MLRHVYGSVIVLWMPLCMLYIDVKEINRWEFYIQKIIPQQTISYFTSNSVAFSHASF